MAKIIVVYDLPDPDGLLEGEKNEEKLDDILHWIQEDLLDTHLVHTMDSLPASTCVSVAVVSDLSHQHANRSIWQRGAN